MFRIFAKCCKEGIHAFNQFLLEQIQNQYSNKCFKGSYIKSVNRIIQRSAIQVGDFLRDGSEVVSLTIRANVSQIHAECGSLIVAQVQEVNQSHSNTMKLVICKGIGDYEMTRVYITIENAQADRYQFTTGQIIVAIIQEALYREEAIHIIAHPYIPMTSSIIYDFDIAKFDHEYINTITQKIRLCRAKLNAMPQQSYQGVLKLMCRSTIHSDQGTYVEDVDFSKQLLLELSPISLFTGVIYPSNIDPNDVRILRCKSDQTLVSILHKIHIFIKVMEQLVSSIKTQKDLQSFQNYIDNAYQDTQTSN